MHHILLLVLSFAFLVAGEATAPRYADVKPANGSVLAMTGWTGTLALNSGDKTGGQFTVSYRQKSAKRPSPLAPRSPAPTTQTPVDPDAGKPPSPPETTPVMAMYPAGRTGTCNNKVPVLLLSFVIIVRSFC